MTAQFKSNVMLEDDVQSDLVARLNRALAESTDLYLKTKQAHWNVRGAFFFARHELFDKLAENRLEEQDMIAERVGTLGGYAAGSLQWSAQQTTLQEYGRDVVSGEAHIRALVDAYTDACGKLRDDVKAAGPVDPVTEDLLIEVLRRAELDLWFLQSHLTG